MEKRSVSCSNVFCLEFSKETQNKNSETDIDQVLQTHNVFTSVSKGVLAKKSDLSECFNTTDEEKVCLEVIKSNKNK